MKRRSAFQAALAVELARAGLSQRALADRLGIPDTTLSDWVRGTHPAPDDLTQEIESALRLPKGTFPAVERKGRL